MITQGKWYKTIELSGMVQIRGGNTGTTADKSICPIGFSNCTTDEDESNAALIAAAPDLLEACKAIRLVRPSTGLLAKATLLT
jgi:hypothetical protein